MPILSEGSKVLVSGANGYIGMWVVRLLLEQGYSVRAVVRSEQKGDFLSQYFRPSGLVERLDFAYVTDFTKEGAFDDAVKDIDGVVHTASPFTLEAKNSNDLMSPAIQGTVGILQSALKTGTQLKRIVITSSCGAVATPSPNPRKFSEEDWNIAAVEDFKKNGEKTAPMTIYRASKVLAEQAAWDLYHQHKAQINWDLVVLHPPLVFGPPINELKSPSSLNASIAFWYDAVIRGDEMFSTKQGLSVSNSWVDVRDIALGHVLALQKQDAAGQRIIIAGGTFIWQEWLKAANALPQSPVQGKLQQGFPEIIDESSDRVIQVSYDISKERQILGLKYKSRAETTKDTLEEFAKRGW
ncbi:D-lactaldehyde dehydrogenase [Crepidotus variabilis]|uniref:D-lactaldehyde dehydrogenase n=1 Tax=Crepidotus variabilis TaxID=179855 RepID=A0A9P6EFC7_9AGAR|nr:D-lactaldehyde dehydrogenase [Crepidotus variabilis]